MQFIQGKVSSLENSVSSVYSFCQHMIAFLRLTIYCALGTEVFGPCQVRPDGVLSCDWPALTFRSSSFFGIQKTFCSVMDIAFMHCFRDIKYTQFYSVLFYFVFYQRPMIDKIFPHFCHNLASPCNIGSLIYPHCFCNLDAFANTIQRSKMSQDYSKKSFDLTTHLKNSHGPLRAYRPPAVLNIFFPSSPPFFSLV